MMKTMGKYQFHLQYTLCTKMLRTFILILSLWLQIKQIGPAGQQTYRAYVLNIPTATAATTTTTTTAIFKI